MDPARSDTFPLPPAEAWTPAYPGGARRAFPVAGPVSFLAGALTAFTVSLVGEMPVGELVLILVTGWAFLVLALTHEWPGPLVRNPLFVALMVCQGVALAAYVVSDVYRGSTPHDMARGWGRMVFLAIDLAAVAYLLGCSARNFPRFVLGVQAGAAAAAFIHGPLFGDIWKFGVGVPLTVAALMLASRGGLVVAGLAACVMGLVHFAMDFRSLGMICLLVAVLTGVQLFPRAWRAWVVPVGLAAGLVAVSLVYQYTQASREDRRSSRSNIDRSAMVLAATEAFKESPFLGHGSWFNRSDVIDNYLLIRDAAAKEAGIGGFAGPNEEVEGVSLHSQILVALAEGGLFGAAFFIVFTFAIVWGLREQVIVREWRSAAPLRVFVLCLAFFNVFLSPFSGAHRVHIALAAGLLVLLHQERIEAADDDREELA